MASLELCVSLVIALVTVYLKLQLTELSVISQSSSMIDSPLAINMPNCKRSLSITSTQERHFVLRLEIIWKMRNPGNSKDDAYRRTWFASDYL
jgi:hypothetical protein